MIIKPHEGNGGPDTWGFGVSTSPCALLLPATCFGVGTTCFIGITFTLLLNEIFVLLYESFFLTSGGFSGAFLGGFLFRLLLLIDILMNKSD